MKLRYQDVERISKEMLESVSQMERHLADLKKRTDIFYEKIHDPISESAVTLVSEFATQIKALREAIENKAERVESATNRLNRVENILSREIDKI